MLLAVFYWSHTFYSLYISSTYLYNNVFTNTIHLENTDETLAIVLPEAAIPRGHFVAAKELENAKIFVVVDLFVSALIKTFKTSL